MPDQDRLRTVIMPGQDRLRTVIKNCHAFKTRMAVLYYTGIISAGP